MKIQIPDDFDPEKSYGADNVFVPPHSPTAPSISSQGKNTLSLSPLGTDTWEADCTLTHGSGCGLLILIYLFLTSRSDAPFPQKIIFSRAAAGYGKGIRILRQDPFEMLITFIISQRKSIPAIRSSVEKLCLAAGKEITKTGGLFTHFPPRQRSGNYLSMN